MIGLAGLIILTLQHLHTRAVIRLKAEIIRFVMAGFIGQPVCIMLVAGKAGPASLSDSKQLADQKATNLVGLLLTQDKLALAVSIGVVIAILHLVQLFQPAIKRH